MLARLLSFRSPEPTDALALSKLSAIGGNLRLALAEKLIRDSTELALVSEIMSDESGAMEWSRWSKVLLGAAARAGARHGAAEAQAQLAAAQAQVAPVNAGGDAAMAQG